MRINKVCQKSRVLAKTNKLNLYYFICKAIKKEGLICTWLLTVISVWPWICTPLILRIGEITELSKKCVPNILKANYITYSNRKKKSKLLNWNKVLMFGIIVPHSYGEYSVFLLNSAGIIHRASLTLTVTSAFWSQGAVRIVAWQSDFHLRNVYQLSLCPCLTCLPGSAEPQVPSPGGGLKERGQRDWLNQD